MQSDAALTADEPSSLRVAMRPFRATDNRYTLMFGEGLQSAGIDVREMDIKSMSDFKDFDVLVIHWPNEFFFFNSIKQWVKGWILLALLSWRRRIKVIWVVHNVLPHVRNGRPSRMLRKAFLARVNGLIFLSRTSRDLLRQTFPQFSDLPWTVISHGIYPPVGAQPSAAAVIGDRPVRLAFTGMVTPYKAPDQLAALVAAMPASQVELQISGRCRDLELKARLEQLAGDNVRLDLRYQEEAELEAVVDASDAVVLPYRDIVNSGSALLALSRFRPVLAPSLGSLLELQQEVGKTWVHLYDGDLTAEVLSGFIDMLRQRQAPDAPDLAAHSWSHISQEVGRFASMLGSVERAAFHRQV